MTTFLFTIANVFIIISWTTFQFPGGLGIDVATTVPPKLLDILKNTNSSRVTEGLNKTRRILSGTDVKDQRPYMVYLRLPKSSKKFQEYRHWLCGGVIIHAEYILTSAACIEDAKHFYIISGTFSYNPEDDIYSNNCIKNGAKKAVWKCVPKNYVFDGHENDNLRWMNNDIAVVKTEDEFNFERRIRGCDFVPKPICYNNQSKYLEEPDTTATIAGWGSTDRYKDWVNTRRVETAQELLETDVTIINKNQCKVRWGKRYHNIIDNYMICTRDNIPHLSEICQEKYADCDDIMYTDDEESRRVINPSHLYIHSAYHNETHYNNGSRRSFREGSGGFCENDHGGPLVHGTGINSIVIGIISACLVKERTNKCYGPFLYTSIYKNRALIDCAVFKDIGKCQKLFRASITHTEEELSWIDHPDGPAKNEVAALRRAEELKKQEATTKASNVTLGFKGQDDPNAHGGLILRSFQKHKNNTGDSYN